MNYVNFSNQNFHLGSLFNEIDIDEEQRVDAIIADISYFYEESNTCDGTRRNQLFNRFLELCEIGGQRFILLEVSEDILYSESNELQKIISRIQRQTGCNWELRGVCRQTFTKEQQIDSFKYFVIFYYDNVFVFNDNQFGYCVKNYNINNSKNKYLNIIDYVFSKIEENLL